MESKNKPENDLRLNDGLACEAGEQIDLRLFRHIVAVGLYAGGPFNTLNNGQRAQHRPQMNVILRKLTVHGVRFDDQFVEGA